MVCQATNQKAGREFPSSGCLSSAWQLAQGLLVEWRQYNWVYVPDWLNLCAVYRRPVTVKHYRRSIRRLVTAEYLSSNTMLRSLWSKTRNALCWHGYDHNNLMLNRAFEWLVLLLLFREFLGYSLTLEKFVHFLDFFSRRSGLECQHFPRQFLTCANQFCWYGVLLHTVTLFCAYIYFKIQQSLSQREIQHEDVRLLEHGAV